MCLCLWQRIKMEKKQCSKSRKQQRWRRYLPRMLHERGWRQRPVSSWGGWNLRVALYSRVMYTYHCFFCGGNEFIRYCATLDQCVSCLMGRTSTQIPPPQLWIVINMFIFPCSCLYMRCMNYSWYILRWMICRIEITKMNDKKQQ